MRRTVVVMAAGATLTVAGCRAGREEPVTAPPAESAESTEVATPDEGSTPAPETIVPEVLSPSEGPIRTANPPRPVTPESLPAWEDVESGHPEGATNPPIPVLAVNADGSECFKEWYDPRVVPEQARATGGRVMTEGESSEGTQVECPQERVDALLER